ncbi:MAG: acyl carrier protein [Bdellovibrionales bacterium]|nr:acyl carrier protein [Bdellovibrionales bacterium]
MDLWKRAIEVFNKVMATQYAIDVHDIEKDCVPQWDSLKMMELIIEVQREFSVRFEVGEILRIQSLTDLIGLLEEKRAFIKNEANK